jgi:ERCC4-type nuclease
MEVIIDSREEKLINALRSEYLKKECNHLLFKTESLDCGDIMYQLNHQVIGLIERKTNDDYVSSMTDGRSKNQSIRMTQLKKENPEVLIIYLIEGNFLHKDHQYRNGISRDSFYSSLMNKVIRDHLIVYRTADINDTALIVTKIYDKLIEHEKKKMIVTDERIEYLKTIKLAKKDNMTPKNCYVCQLAQIPGVSIEMADFMAQQYPSISQLVMSYESLQTLEEKENLLAELLIPIANNKKRRLGHILSKRIYEYLYNVGEKKKLTLKVKNT